MVAAVGIGPTYLLLMKQANSPEFYAAMMEPVLTLVGKLSSWCG